MTTRRAAADTLLSWLNQGGPSPGSYRKGAGAPPLTHFSDRVRARGTRLCAIARDHPERL